MNIPTNVNTYLRYVATGGQVSFLAPGLTLSGAPYALEATHEIMVNGLPTTIPWSYDSTTGVITFTSGLASGDIVQIWRRTTIDESLVSFPVATQWTPKHNNKSITQLLMLIQELWGGIKEVKDDLQTYVNSAVASVFEFSGTAAATWSTSVEAGDTQVVTPYSFTKGLFMAGGTVYNLSDASDATLDNTGEFTIINFPSPFIVSMDALLVVL